MARAIDADELEMFPYSEGAGTEEQISEWIEQTGLSEDDTASRARDLCWKVIDGFINVVKTQPTLTPPNEWVSVEDRLPDPDFPGQQRGFYLVALSNGTVKELMYEFRHYENMMFDVGWHETAFPVTHWMLLPAPPDRRPPEGEA